MTTNYRTKVDSSAEVFYVSELPSPESLIGLSSLNFLPMREIEIVVMMCFFLLSSQAAIQT